MTHRQLQGPALNTARATVRRKVWLTIASPVWRRSAKQARPRHKFAEVVILRTETVIPSLDHRCLYLETLYGVAITTNAGLTSLAMAQIASQIFRAVPTMYPVARQQLGPCRISSSIRYHEQLRHFSYSRSLRKGETFTSRLRKALKQTKIEWRPIPIAVGIGFLGLFQFYRIQQREQRRKLEELEEQSLDSNDGNGNKRPRKRKRIKPSGPWCAGHSISEYNVYHH